MSMRFQAASGHSPNGVRAAWRQFVDSGTIDAARVRMPIAQAWRRSRTAGCDPYQVRADVLSPADTAALIRAEGRLVEIATPFLAALSRAAGAERHAAMLGDASGRVLKIVGDAETVADENFPRAGSLLSEATAGANGIGTALAEGSYVELVGPEHFIEGFHVFTCQGVPLLGLRREPVGVLSMSVRKQATAAKVRDILFCASEAAECELLSERLTETLASAAPLEHILEALRQDIVQRIAMARLQFELAARQIAAGTDAFATLSAAQQLIQKFRRQAAVWRNLVGQSTAAAEPAELADLVDDFISLMETEARVAHVQLAWKRADRSLVFDDVQALSQRLLTALLNAIQVTLPGGQITVSLVKLEREAVVMLGSRLADGSEYVDRVAAPLVR
jgi:sigma-54 dependent transcriptional regulator, acetoin dehydrogenase operon transcriptional activator AcoR